MGEVISLRERRAHDNADVIADAYAEAERARHALERSIASYSTCAGSDVCSALLQLEIHKLGQFSATDEGNRIAAGRIELTADTLQTMSEVGPICIPTVIKLLRSEAHRLRGLADSSDG